jgi:hypothetical protein
VKVRLLKLELNTLGFLSVSIRRNLQHCGPANLGPIFIKSYILGHIFVWNFMIFFNWKTQSWICPCILNISSICTHVLGWSMWLYSSSCVLGMTSAGCSCLADCGFYSFSVNTEYEIVKISTQWWMWRHGNSIATLTVAHSNNLLLIWHGS